MSVKIAPCYFAPDLDNAWSVAPGALSSMNAFAPLMNGAYGSIGTASLFALTGTDMLSAKLFRQVNGSVRLLVFRPGNIDEYNSTGTRTNQGTGYSASTARWSAAAWGNQIIACNYLDATQSSTGTTFGALGGSSPKARHVAANVDFVMMADVDDGGSNVYSDMVWWSGLRNPASWTPALSTQAGNVRLLDSPGPIKALVAFRDSFVAFKDNAIFVGEYVGPPPNGYIFSWRMVSARIGCIAPEAVCELDGRLYFLHSSGFYEFDGQNLRNVGLPVFQSFQSEGGFIARTGTTLTTGSSTAEGIATAQATADDIEGVVWFRTSSIVLAQTTQQAVLYGYNPRSGKWGRHKVTTGSQVASTYPRLVFGSYADAQAFKADTSGRFWMLWNDNAGSSLRSIRYPVATTDSVAATYTTGLFGSNDGSDLIDKHYWRTLYGTSSDTGITLSVAGYTSENQNITNGTTTGAVNTELDEGDVTQSARYRAATVTWTAGKTTLLAGVGFNGKGGGKR